MTGEQAELSKTVLRSKIDQIEPKYWSVKVGSSFLQPIDQGASLKEAALNRGFERL